MLPGAMTLVLNLVALLLVLGLSWTGMMWMARWIHSSRSPVDDWETTPLRRNDPCPECDGVGAQQRFGQLEPCPLCEGRGVITSLPN